MRQRGAGEAIKFDPTKEYHNREGGFPIRMIEFPGAGVGGIDIIAHSEWRSRGLRVRCALCNESTETTSGGTTPLTVTRERTIRADSFRFFYSRIRPKGKNH